jgi:hypothetical protein
MSGRGRRGSRRGARPVPRGGASVRWERRLEPWVIAAVSLHSLAVGICLLAFPAWSASFGGWGSASPLFFPRQAGAFHFVVAYGYWREYRRSGSVGLLVATKALATVFLLGAWAAGETAWAVPFSGFADAAMGCAVWWLHRRATR